MQFPVTTGLPTGAVQQIKFTNDIQDTNDLGVTLVSVGDGGTINAGPNSNEVSIPVSAYGFVVEQAGANTAPSPTPVPPTPTPVPPTPTLVLSTPTPKPTASIACTTSPPAKHIVLDNNVYSVIGGVIYEDGSLDGYSVGGDADQGGER